jgi:hypothetical protein
MLEEAIHHSPHAQDGNTTDNPFVLVDNNMPEIPDFSQPLCCKRSMWLEPSF